MKKVLLASILSLVVLTGCGKKETIICTQKQTTNGVTVDSVVNIDIENNRFKGINMVIDIELPDSNLSRKDSIVKQYERMYSNYEKQYGVKPVVSESDKGAKIEINMTADQAKKFSGSNNDKATRKDVIDMFGTQFDCK